MAYSEKVVDHYEHPRNVGTLDKSSSEVGTGLVGAPECGDVMRLQIRVNLRLRLGHRLQLPRHRVGQGQDCRRGPHHHQHRHRQRARPAASKNPLLGSRRGRHPRRHWRLEDQERRCRRSHRRSSSALRSSFSQVPIHDNPPSWMGFITYSYPCEFFRRETLRFSLRPLRQSFCTCF
jgi:NifU-like N terminal domain